MAKIRKGDNVIIVAGKDKNRKGEVTRVIRPKGDNKRKSSVSVLVQGVNLVKKTVRRNPERGIEGGFISKEAPLDISNVAILNPRTQRADRIGYKFLEDGKKVRYFKSDGEIVDVE